MAAAIRDAARGREDVVFDRIGADAHRWHNSIGERAAEDRSFDPSGKTGHLRGAAAAVVDPEPGALRGGPAAAPLCLAGDAVPGRVLRARRRPCRGPTIAWRGWAAIRWTAGCGWSTWPRTSSATSRVLGPRVRNAAHKLKKVVNPTALDYVKALDFYFTAAELEGLYAANPRWAAMERQVYGDLLRL